MGSSWAPRTITTGCGRPLAELAALFIFGKVLTRAAPSRRQLGWGGAAPPATDPGERGRNRSSGVVPPDSKETTEGARPPSAAEPAGE